MMVFITAELLNNEIVVNQLQVINLSFEKSNFSRSYNKELILSW